MNKLVFSASRDLTLGTELELQLLDPQTYNLTPKANKLLERIRTSEHEGEIKPEVTCSMLEITSSIHDNAASLHQELCDINKFLVEQAKELDICVAGGGTHPFQDWQERSIHASYQSVYEKYDFLIKKFTVFGQHIHIGCSSPDLAIYLIHAFSNYLPHLIALSASSPFYEGAETQYSSTRLHLVDAFPLSGHFPFVKNWSEFQEYFAKATKMQVARELRNFYWDIRLRPEFGTIEIRVCDTPLTIMRAAAVAAYAQTLACYFQEERPLELFEEMYLPYATNRFQASRYGLNGSLYVNSNCSKIPIYMDILETLDKLMPYAKYLGNEEYFYFLQDSVLAMQNDAEELRKTYRELGRMDLTANFQSQIWMSEANCTAQQYPLVYC